MNEEEKMYIQAMQCVNELVEEVLERCQEVADENDYEPDWVISRFKTQFASATKK